MTVAETDLAYVLFTNPERTRFARCFPLMENEWRVERASRDHAGDTWGPPQDAGITGTLEDVERHYARHGLIRKEIVRQDRIPVELTRDEWNAVAEAIQWQLDTTDEDAFEVGEDWLLAIRDRILSTPGVH